MIKKRINLWEEGEYSYPMAWGFEPNIVSYIHEEDEESRPCMIIAPGGGYGFVSIAEGEVVAKRFYEKNYNVFVLTYTTDILMREPLKTQPMQDLARAIRKVRENAEVYKVHPNQVVVCGFSAGAHLCGSVCVHDVADTNPVYSEFSNRPNAAILAYPVITSGDEAHRGSFEALYGKNAAEEELEYMSLEKHVTPNTPPCFIWQTLNDETVPVENSFLFADACKQNGVPHALHIFSEGKHGLSLGDEEWAKENWGEPYTKEQIFKIVEAVEKGDITVTEDMKEFLLTMIKSNGEERRANEEVKLWPELAESWLKKHL